MNPIQKAENKGRDLFKSFLDQIGATGKPTEEENDRLDYYFTYKGKNGVAEIKVRYAYYNDYLIETSKYQALVQRKADEGLDGAYYVCFYNNSMYLFTPKIIKQFGVPEKKWCKVTTVFDRGYKLKDVLLVPTDKATRYDYIDGIWQKV